MLLFPVTHLEFFAFVRIFNVFLSIEDQFCQSAELPHLEEGSGRKGSWEKLPHSTASFPNVIAILDQTELTEESRSQQPICNTGNLSSSTTTTEARAGRYT